MWKRGDQTKENLKAAEFQGSQHGLIRISQNISFKEQIHNLKQEKYVNHQVLLQHYHHS